MKKTVDIFFGVVYNAYCQRERVAKTKKTIYRGVAQLG